MRQGKNLEAIKLLRSATNDDGQFALAYSKLSEAQAALGYDNDADQSSRKAVDFSDKLPARERYLILANRARVTHDTAQAIQYYEELVKGSPEDLDVQLTLGSLYEVHQRFGQSEGSLFDCAATRSSIDRGALGAGPGGGHGRKSSARPGVF